MNCHMCEYNGGCQLQEIAPDIKGCIGHSKYKTPEQPAPDKKERIIDQRSQREKETPKLTDFRVGDRVIADINPYNLRIYRLPGYLAGCPLTVIGFTKEKVVCDWDGGDPFRIPPELLTIRQKRTEEAT